MIWGAFWFMLGSWASFLWGSPWAALVLSLSGLAFLAFSVYSRL
jgi:hypothetical protein